MGGEHCQRESEGDLGEWLRVPSKGHSGMALQIARLHDIREIQIKCRRKSMAREVFSSLLCNEKLIVVIVRDVEVPLGCCKSLTEVDKNPSVETVPELFF